MTTTDRSDRERSSRAESDARSKAMLLVAGFIATSAGMEADYRADTMLRAGMQSQADDLLTLLEDNGLTITDARDQA